jgi:hypothetical protein
MGMTPNQFFGAEFLYSPGFDYGHADPASFAYRMQGYPSLPGIPAFPTIPRLAPLPPSFTTADIQALANAHTGVGAGAGAGVGVGVGVGVADHVEDGYAQQQQQQQQQQHAQRPQGPYGW